jgi:hypothetical protein
MKRIIAFLCLLVCNFVGSATAEKVSEEFPPPFYLYVYGGAMSNTGRQTPFHLGGGGEFRISKHFSLGGETGFFRFNENGNVTYDSIRLSIGSSYHFASRVNQRLDPFLAGGIAGRVNFYAGSWGLRNVNPMIDIGGGINYWVSRRFGLKLEFLNHVWFTKGTTVHYPDMRLGLCFGF